MRLSDHENDYSDRTFIKPFEYEGNFFMNKKLSSKIFKWKWERLLLNDRNETQKTKTIHLKSFRNKKILQELFLFDNLIRKTF